MTWYIWLFILLVLGSIVGGLMVLLRTAKPLPLSEEQLTKIQRMDGLKRFLPPQVAEIALTGDE